MSQCLNWKRIITINLLTLLVLAGCVTNNHAVLPTIGRVREPQWELMIARHPVTIAFPHFTGIYEVNRYVNSFHYIDDQDNYGVEDYWATPQEFFTRGGDCEDFAITKYYLILNNHIARDRDMHLWLVYDNNQDAYHLILLVKDMILDNQEAGVIYWETVKFRYTPIHEVLR